MSKKANQVYDLLVEKYDVKTRMEVAAWVISKLQQHATDGGSFRTLVYERLGFDVDGYDPILEAGGMDVCNALYTAAKFEKRGKR